MPITDLTGYTWVGNVTVDVNSVSWGPRVEWFINFTDANNVQYGELDFWDSSGENDYPTDTMLFYTSSPYTGITAYQVGSGWTNNAYKTITFTGGADATSSGLIAWLEANGTLTAPTTDNYTNLYNSTWRFDTAPTLNTTFNYHLYMHCGNSYPEYLVCVLDSGVYKLWISSRADISDSSASKHLIATSDGFLDNNYKQIQIITDYPYTYDARNSTLITWFKTNATCVVAPLNSLENTSWHIDDCFNANNNKPTYSINFTSNNANYISLTIYYDSDDGTGMWYGINGNDYSITVYDMYNNEFTNSALQDISITSGADVTDLNLIRTFQLYATLQTEPEPTPSSSITIGNLNISSMSLGNQPITAMYFGTIKIYEASTPTPSEPEVTITFQNAINPGFWDYTKIYDNYTLYNGDFRPSGNVIAQITSADGSVTVTSTTGKLSIESMGPSVSKGTVTISGNITQAATSYINALVGAFDITGDGSIVVDGTNYDS